MKTILSAILGGWLALALSGSTSAQPTATAQATDPAELEQARAIIAIMFPPAERMRMFDKMQADLIAQMRPMLPAALLGDPGLKSLMDAYIEQATARQRVVIQKHMPTMFEAMASAYSHEFSLAELKDILDSLTPREAKVLRMRFGIEMSTDHTLEEVGKQFDVTRERIRQIEAKALRKLKHPSRSDKLRSFIDTL